MFDFLTTSFSSIFKTITGQRYLNEKNIETALAKVHESLLEADVPYPVIEQFIAEIKSQIIGKKVLNSLNPTEQFIKVVHDALTAFLGNNLIQPQFSAPSIIMVMGLQGSGKTTTIGKLARWLHEEYSGKRILCASIDFYRPAAIDQLELLARQANVASYRSRLTNPVQAARDCLHHYKQHKFDYLLLDTAGRLHVDSAMLQELQTINTEIEPHYKLLVLDAMTGQESLRVAQAFDTAIRFDAAILTKTDSDTRSGAAFAFSYQIKKPIMFLGSGEKLEDLDLFKPDRMAGRILGMGDVHTLLERANKKIKESDQKEAEDSLSKGRLTYSDFAKQLEMMNRLGSVSQLLKYIPGVSAASVSPEMVHQSERQMKQFKAIINSMTPKERKNMVTLNNSRRKRIAKGSGLSLQVVNNLVEQFEKTQQFVKLFSKTGKFPGF